MNARELTLFYYKAWKEKYNGKPYTPAFGKHGALFKRLLQAGHSGEEVLGYIKHYLSDSSNTFSARTGHSIEHFSSALPSIIAAISAAGARRAASAGSEATNPDFEALEQARKNKGAK